MVNIFIAARLLLKYPVTVVKFNNNNWGFQVELKAGVYLVVPAGGPVRVQGMVTSSTLRQMNIRPEVCENYLESKGLSKCFVIAELIDYIQFGGVVSVIKIAIEKKIVVV